MLCLSVNQMDRLDMDGYGRIWMSSRLWSEISTRDDPQEKESVFHSLYCWHSTRGLNLQKSSSCVRVNTLSNDFNTSRQLGSSPNHPMFELNED
jgi:hypothetical protein